MKKTLSIILTLFLLFALTGCNGTAADNSSPKEILQPLTEEDKALQAKIAEYSNTKVDFRYNRQEKLGDVTYNMSFLEIKSIGNGVIYTNELGDEFKYDIDTGEIVNVVLDSNVVTKTESSIDIDTAHKIALEYFPKDKDIDEYKQSIYKEDEDGYVIWYTRYIGKYQTTDAFRIKLSFEGKPIYITYATKLSDAIKLYKNKNTNFDEEFITSKIKNYEEGKGITNVDYDNAIVLTKDGNFYVSVAYEIVTDSGTKSCFVTDIPLE